MSNIFCQFNKEHKKQKSLLYSFITKTLVLSGLLANLVFFPHKMHSNFYSQENSFAIDDLLLRTAKNKQLSLVLDLDETIIFARENTVQPEIEYFYIDLKYCGQKFLVQKRPYLNQFLKATSKLFTIYIYTAAMKQYADSIIDEIDKGKIIKDRFYRQHCQYVDGMYIKNLSKIRKEGSILIDDNFENYLKNKSNCLRIKAWNGENKDSQLKKYFNLLKRLIMADNLMEQIKLIHRQMLY